MWNENPDNNNSNSNSNIGTYHDTYSPSFSNGDNEIINFNNSNEINNSNIKHYHKYHSNVVESDNINITIDNYQSFDDLKKKNKRKRIIRNLIIYLLIAIVILIVFLIIKMPRKNEKKEIITPSDDNSIKNIYIDDGSLSPTFNGDIHDYYVLTDKNEIEIKCELGLNSSGVVGCNKKIKLSNKAYFIHQIYSADGTLFNINIKTKDDKGEGLISIDSITGLNKKSNTSVNMKVNATSKSGQLTYSIDNGLTYQTSNNFVINENKKIYLVVRDEYGNMTPTREIDINNIDNQIPTGSVEITKSSSDSVTVTAFGKDNDKDLLYSFDGGEFTKENTIKIKEPRQIRVYIKDSAGNTSTELGITVRQSDFVDKKKFVANYYANGSIIDNNYAVCTSINNECIVTLPNITREGYEILGWSENKNSKEPEYKINQRVSLKKNINLYAITKKAITVTFDYNGILPNKHVKNCYIYGDEKCYVEVPEFTFDKGKIIGWNLNKDNETALSSSTNNFYTDEDITLYALAYTSLKMKFDKNGADSISSEEMKCKVINNNEGCHVSLPIIQKEGAEILGWSTNPNNVQAEYQINTKSLIKDNLKLYAITKTVVNLDFDKNGADAITNSRLTCVFYNKDKECTIKTPYISRKNANIIGWNTDSTSHSAIHAQNETLTVKKDAKYFAITSVPVNVYFDKNGASTISFTNQSCIYYNTDRGCYINTPSITRAGWNVIGFNRSQNGQKAELKTNSSELVSSSATYYAVTGKSAVAYFQKNRADGLFGCSTKTASGCQERCSYYNKANSCKIKVPYIVSKGNEVQLFSTTTNEDSLTGYTPGSYMSINSDITLYAIVKNYYRKNTYSIVKTQTFGHVPFETESGCPASIYTNYYNFTSRLYNKAPYIFGAGKVTFTGKSSFENTWGSGSAGMTYGRVIGYRNVDVICPSTFDRYYLKTIVHELTHAWDSYYKLQYGQYLSSMPDIVNLYNKYSNKSANNRPLRDYSYTNRFEFVADMFAWYYFLYLDPAYTPSAISKRSYYPSDMKKTMEKYIILAKKGYK